MSLMWEMSFTVFLFSNSNYTLTFHVQKTSACINSMRELSKESIMEALVAHIKMCLI